MILKYLWEHLDEKPKSIAEIDAEIADPFSVAKLGRLRSEPEDDSEPTENLLQDFYEKNSELDFGEPSAGWLKTIFAKTKERQA